MTTVTAGDGTVLDTSFDTTGQLTEAINSEWVNDPLDTYRIPETEGKKGDGLFSNEELHRFLFGLGIAITEKQASILVQIYGADGVVGKNTVLVDMVRDGVITPQLSPIGEVVRWSLNLDAMNADRVAAAIYRIGSEGYDYPGGLTADQYQKGVSELFGDKTSLDMPNAQKIVRHFGSGDRINQDQIARTLNLRESGLYKQLSGGPIHISWSQFTDSGKDIIPITVGPIGLPAPGKLADGSPDWTPTKEGIRNILTYYADDGLLTKRELKDALQSAHDQGTDIPDYTLDFYMRVYGTTNENGLHHIDAAGIDEMIADGTVGVTKRTEGGYGFSLNGAMLPLDKLILRWPNEMVATAEEVHSLFAAMGLRSISKEQVNALITVYGGEQGPGTIVGRELLEMVTDGVFVGKDGKPLEVGEYTAKSPSLVFEHFSRGKPPVGKGSHIYDVQKADFSKIPGASVAKAIYNLAGKDPEKDRLTPAELSKAVDTLNGHNGSIGKDAVDALVRLSNTASMGSDQPFYSGTISYKELSSILDAGLLDAGPSTAGPTFLKDNHLAAFKDSTLVFEFLGTYDTSGNGKLSQREFETALKSPAFKGLKSPERVANRLFVLLADKADKSGIRQITSDQLLKAVENGVFALGPKPGAALTVNFARLSKSALVDAMFRYHGKDPATDALTAKEFDAATDHVMGDRMAVDGTDAKFLVKNYGNGVSGTGQEPALTHADLLDVFESELDLLFPNHHMVIPIGNNIDPKHRTPTYESPWTWSNMMSILGDAGAMLIAQLAAQTNQDQTTVRRVLGVASWAASNPAIAKKVYDALLNMLKAGTGAASGAVNKLVDYLTGGTVPSLSAEGKKMLKQAAKDLGKAGSDLGAATLMQLFSLDQEAAVNLINQAAATKTLSQFDMGKALKTIGFDPQVMSDAFDQMLATADIVDPKTGQQATGGRRLQLWAELPESTKEYLRLDIGIEADFMKKIVTEIPGASYQDGTVMINGAQVRFFFTSGTKDEKGNVTYQLRCRFMGYVGAETGSRDGGLFNTTDIVMEFKSTRDQKTKKLGDGVMQEVSLQTTTGLMAEWTLKAKDLVDDPNWFMKTVEDWKKQLFGPLTSVPQVKASNARINAAMEEWRRVQRQPETELEKKRHAAAEAKKYADEVKKEYDNKCKTIAGYVLSDVGQAFKNLFYVVSAAAAGLTAAAQGVVHRGEVEVGFGSGVTTSIPLWSKTKGPGDLTTPTRGGDANLINAIAIGVGAVSAVASQPLLPSAESMGGVDPTRWNAIKAIIVGHIGVAGSSLFLNQLKTKDQWNIETSVSGFAWAAPRLAKIDRVTWQDLQDWRKDTPVTPPIPDGDIEMSVLPASSQVAAGDPEITPADPPGSSGGDPETSSGEDVEGTTGTTGKTLPNNTWGVTPRFRFQVNIGGSTPLFGTSSGRTLPNPKTPPTTNTTTPATNSTSNTTTPATPVTLDATMPSTNSTSNTTVPTTPVTSNTTTTPTNDTSNSTVPTTPTPSNTTTTPTNSTSNPRPPSEANMG